ncbi:circularly permuted type 2 ATP-grasp protein [Halorhodospira halophila]|uniref:Circularly permuted ATP-grasp type 2 domain-containing protein n=1 Tax=Halorhodospira halophila (strain DSM 244 / SL1) TaxID=349124 RepID=A1WTU0_HALHL|nr:circularly permuted type 2 ATP-grasp protein [Halorhodospira halophila]ABM61102.1 protein of unknown function DUF404 [Halorhodospira halophila SL1]MBK1729819.1 circularly permuted type 2 ATP-grasp protein [Halorhodospira halophila]
MAPRFQGFDTDQRYDELLRPDGTPRPAARLLFEYLRSICEDDLAERMRAVDAFIRDKGVTFTVYSDGENIDRAWPLDVIPRVVDAREWAQIEAGLKQRLAALNALIEDLYNDQAAIRDGILPREILEQSRNFRPQCQGLKLPYGAWAHICGTDLVRDRDGTLYVLEDNLRVPSGVSYMLENREVMKQVFPEPFEGSGIRPLDHYPGQLLDALISLAPADADDPEVVLLTPGIYNAAYFEHTYLAQQMGIELVEGRDLFVGDDDCVYMRTIYGPVRVHVIYRRIDDDFLDPEVFRPDSALGVRGLMRAWRAGRVAIANAPGAGVADNKAVYSFVPELIRYYLGEAPLLANVPTWRCLFDNERAYVLEHLDELVVKPANESGGYGMLIGPHSDAATRQAFAEQILADPANFIAQPTLSLSTVPTFNGEVLEPRHVDLRPFVLQAARQHVTTGGLSRVSNARDSLVVNSSQGGSSKDTWVVDVGSDAEEGG